MKSHLAFFRWTVLFKIKQNLVHLLLAYIYLCWSCLDICHLGATCRFAHGLTHNEDFWALQASEHFFFYISRSSKFCTRNSLNILCLIKLTFTTLEYSSLYSKFFLSFQSAYVYRTGTGTHIWVRNERFNTGRTQHTFYISCTGNFCPLTCSSVILVLLYRYKYTGIS
jgi:hypothetical protein